MVDDATQIAVRLGALTEVLEAARTWLEENAYRRNYPRWELEMHRLEAAILELDGAIKRAEGGKPCQTG